MDNSPSRHEIARALGELREIKRKEPAVNDVVRKRELRDERHKLKADVEYLYTIYRSKIQSYKTVSVSERMIEFLTSAYLGPLYGNPKYGEDIIGHPIREYLFFLNPDDDFYGYSSSGIISTLLRIYLEINDIFSFSVDRLIGGNNDDQIRSFFQEEYDDYYRELLAHQEKYGEVEGELQKNRLDGRPFRPDARITWRLPQEGITDFQMVGRLVSSNTEPVEIITENEQIPADDIPYLTSDEYKQFLEKQIPLTEALSYSEWKIPKHPEVRDDPEYNPFKSLGTQTKPARS